MRAGYQRQEDEPSIVTCAKCGERTERGTHETHPCACIRAVIDEQVQGFHGLGLTDSQMAAEFHYKGKGQVMKSRARLGLEAHPECMWCGLPRGETPFQFSWCTLDCYQHQDRAGML